MEQKVPLYSVFTWELMLAAISSPLEIGRFPAHDTVQEPHGPVSALDTVGHFPVPPSLEVSVTTVTPGAR